MGQVQRTPRHIGKPGAYVLAPHNRELLRRAQRQVRRSEQPARPAAPPYHCSTKAIVVMPMGPAPSRLRSIHPALGSLIGALEFGSYLIT